MKKLIALLLALIICLGLTACASADEKALEAANALLESGEYEAALAAYQEIPLYQEIYQKIEEASSHLVTFQVEPYVGIWKDLNSNMVMTIRADGTMQVVDDNGGSFDTMVGFYDGGVYLYGDVKPVEINGVTHLKDSYNDFVSDENYETLCAKPVEITLENWETYFELQDVKDVHRNAFGEVEHVRMGYGIFLRDEYAEKLKDEWNSVQVTFKLQYEEEHHYIDGDYPDGEWELGKQFVSRWYTYETQEQVGEVWYRAPSGEEESAYNDHYAADFALGWISDWDSTTQSNKFNACIPINPEVVDVTGTLIMFP